MITEFYGPFHGTVQTTEKESERASGERILGKDPVSGMTLLVRIGRFGPMAQIGTPEETEKPKFAKLRAEQRLDQITFDEAIELFKLPRNLGPYEDHDVNVAIGRFGPYVRLNDFFVSMKKEDDPYTITYERAVELIEEKRKQNAERLIMSFPDEPEIQVLNGRWGPYIKYKDRNIRIAKDRDPKTFTLPEIHELAEKTPISKSRFGAKKGGFVKKAFVPKKAAGTKSSVTKAAASKKAAVIPAPAIKAAPAKKAATKKAAPTKKAAAPAKKKVAVKKKAAVKKK
jgi:DNA topoisomerase-1